MKFKKIFLSDLPEDLLMLLETVLILGGCIMFLIAIIHLLFSSDFFCEMTFSEANPSTLPTSYCTPSPRALILGVFLIVILIILVIGIKKIRKKKFKIKGNNK